MSLLAIDVGNTNTVLGLYTPIGTHALLAHQDRYACDSR